MEKGFRHSEETKRKMSEALKGNERSKGNHLSIETRRKISEAGKGRRHSLASRKKMSEATKGRRGHPRTKATRRKMSKSMKKIRASKGLLPTNVVRETYRIRNGIELRLWREAVFARDNWTCQDCLIRGGELQAHHIKSFTKYPELRTSIENGLTLCLKCHKKRHRKRKGQ